MQFPNYAKQKDSGIEWLGQIPDGWEIKKLGYIGNSIIGLTYSPSDISNEDDGVLVLRSTNLQENKIVNKDNVYVNADVPEKLRLKNNDILICSRNGSRELIGKNGKVTEDYIGACFGAFTTVFRSEFNDFIYYVLNSRLFEFQSGSFLTTTINQLTTGTLKTFKIPLPPLDEQQKIASFLDYKTQQIDQLIEKKKALIEKLNEQRIAVITQAVTKGMDNNAKMKPSGVDWLGDVPEHWETRRLKFLTNESLQYGANEAAVLDDRDLPRFIRITDVKDDGTLHDDTFRSLPEEVAEPFLLDEGDILLARSGATVGKTFKYSKSWGKSAYAGYLIKFSVDREIMAEDFAYMYFQSSVYWANINSTLIQATIQNFSAEKYANIELPLPELDEQRVIVDYLSKNLNRLDKMKSLAQKVIERLEEYRSSLITDAVTGKIDVRNIVIGEVV